MYKRQEEANSKAIEFRQKFNIAEDDIVFLFSGRLTPEKGAEELLKAFTEVAQKVPNTKLVIAGAFFFNSITARGAGSSQIDGSTQISDMA